MTGNFEVTVFKNADHSDAGCEIYSKKKTGSFPQNNEAGMNEGMKKLDAYCK